LHARTYTRKHAALVRLALMRPGAFL